MRVDGKICVVTGAASGMGRALAIQLATMENIAGLAICDVNETDLNETARLARVKGVKVTTALVDVSDRAKVEAWKDQVVADFGGCDILFNNAGINANGRLIYGPHDDIKALERGWDRCFNIDFFGVLYCCKAFLPVLISRKEAYIINTSSVNAFWTWPEHSCYTAAKHAVKGLTDSLLIELKIKAPHVKIALLHPGGVKTNIAQNTVHPNKGTRQAELLAEGFSLIADLTSEQAADWIISAVKKDQYRVLVGYDAWFIDKMTRIFPTRIYDFYEQVGREGINVDPFDPNNKNHEKIGLLALVRIFLAGFWINLPFFMFMPLFKLRHTALGQSILLGLGASVAYKGYTLMNGRSKL